METVTRNIVYLLLAVATSRAVPATAMIYAYDRFNETSTFEDLEATFGPSVSGDGMVGLLVRAEPYNGCKDIKPPPFVPNVDENITIYSFALITRGECDFGLKVLNAQIAGYRAAIVHNVGSNSLVRMSSSLPDITNKIFIPAVFIGQTSATLLNATYLYNKGGSPYIQLYEGSFNPLDYYLVPFIVVIAVCFVSLVCFLLIKCLRDRRRARRGRLSLQRLKKLPVKKFDKGDEYDVCAICLEDYEEGDSLRILPCDHAYHCKCVDPWLTSSKRICPLCKRRVLSDDESTSSSDDAESSEDERTPLVRSSAASSPNAPRYATGYSNRNPLARRAQNRGRGDANSSSDDTTSTDVSDAEMPQPRRAGPKVVTISESNTPHTSSYQSQQLRVRQNPEEEIANAMASPVLEPDDYLNSAEVMMAGPNRVSESSIAVLSDIETLESTPEPHSYSSQDFHSLDESLTVAQTPLNLDSRRSAVPDSDQDDIIVIAHGSKTQMRGQDGEV